MKNLRSRLGHAALIVLVYVFIDQYGYFLKLIGWRQYISEWLYVLAIRNAFEVGTCVIALAIMLRFGLKRAARELGFLAPMGRGLAFAAIATLPMLITFAFTMPLNPNMTFLTVG